MREPERMTASTASKPRRQTLRGELAARMECRRRGLLYLDRETVVSLEVVGNAVHLRTGKLPGLVRLAKAHEDALFVSHYDVRLLFDSPSQLDEASGGLIHKETPPTLLEASTAPSTLRDDVTDEGDVELFHERFQFTWKAQPMESMHIFADDEIGDAFAASCHLPMKAVVSGEEFEEDDDGIPVLGAGAEQRQGRAARAAAFSTPAVAAAAGASPGDGSADEAELTASPRTQAVIEVTARRLSRAPQLEPVLRMRSPGLLGFLEPGHRLRPSFDRALERHRSEIPEMSASARATIAYSSSSDDEDEDEDDAVFEEAAQAMAPAEQDVPADAATVMAATAQVAAALPASLGMRVLRSAAEACAVDIGDVGSEGWRYRTAWEQCLAANRALLPGRNTAADRSRSVSAPAPPGHDGAGLADGSKEPAAGAREEWGGYDAQSLEGDDWEAEAARQAWSRPADQGAASHAFLSKEAAAGRARVGDIVAGDAAEALEAELARACGEAGQQTGAGAGRGRERYARRVIKGLKEAEGRKETRGLSAEAVARLQAARTRQRLKRQHATGAPAPPGTRPKLGEAADAGD